MSKNEGNVDRIVRAVVAVAAFGGAAAVGLGSIGGIVLAVVGVIMAVTAAVGFCPLYRLVGVNTCPLDAKAS
jgi:hypothetical protein